MASYSHYLKTAMFEIILNILGFFQSQQQQQTQIILGVLPRLMVSFCFPIPLSNFHLRPPLYNSHLFFLVLADSRCIHYYFSFLPAMGTATKNHPKCKKPCRQRSLNQRLRNGVYTLYFRFYFEKQPRYH